MIETRTALVYSKIFHEIELRTQLFHLCILYFLYNFFCLRNLFILVFSSFISIFLFLLFRSFSLSPSIISFPPSLFLRTPLFYFCFYLISFVWLSSLALLPFYTAIKYLYVVRCDVDAARS